MCSSRLSVPILMSSEPFTDSMTLSVSPWASTISRSSWMRSRGQTSPAGMSKSVPTMPLQPGIWLISSSVIFSSLGPYQRKVSSMSLSSLSGRAPGPSFA